MNIKKNICVCIVYIIFCNFIISLQGQAASEKALNKCDVLINEAIETRNVDSWNTALDCAVKINAKDNEQMPAEILDLATQMNLDRYNTVKENKYKKYALRYASLAMRNNTQNIQTPLAGIVLSSENLDIKSMIMFYDYLCKINPNAGNAIKDVFAENIANVKQMKANNSAATWATVGGLLYTRLQNRPSYSTTNCTTGAGGFVNCNTTSY